MTACGRLGCEQLATTEIRPQYGRSYFRCDEHVAESVAVEDLFANRQSSGASTRRLA